MRWLIWEIRFAKLALPISRLFIWFTPLVDLVIRLYIAEIFFTAGLTKIQSWQTTLMLFNNVYNVPLLPPNIAAVMGTGAELILPILFSLLL